MAGAGMVWVRAGAGGMGKSAVTSAAVFVTFVVSPSSRRLAGWVTLVVTSAMSRAAESMGGILGRVAESSSAADASVGAMNGAPQLGHAIVDPGASGVRRPQSGHTISCIELLQRKRAGEARQFARVETSEARYLARVSTAIGHTGAGPDSVCPAKR